MTEVPEDETDDQGVIALSESEYEETEEDLALFDNKNIREEDDSHLPNLKHATVLLPDENPEIFANYI